LKSEMDDLVDPAVAAAHIRAFFVHPDWARRGIGRRIIEACEAAAKADGFSSLELDATLPGEPFYTAMGYEVTGRFDVPMPDGESLPGVHMVKSLA
jgi:GNAT superfamily N-acetyltransferase